MNFLKLRTAAAALLIAFFLAAAPRASFSSDKLDDRAPYLLDLRAVDKDFFVQFAAGAHIKTGDRRGFYLQVKLDGGALSELEKRGALLASTYDWSRLPPGVNPPATDYSSDGIISGLYNLAAQYPALCKYAVFGTSVKGKKIAGIRIAGNGAALRGKTELRILGAHHGNEITSGTIPYLIAKKLLEDYAAGVEKVKYLLDNSSILILPLVNPDGRDAGRRENANGSDLNREYGFHYQATDTNFTPFNEPEILAVAKDHLSRGYAMSFSFHNYGDIVNYVWNYTGTRSLDDAMISSAADEYGAAAGYSVTEGYDWYQTFGDANDFSYGVSGDFDYTIEIAEETDAKLETTLSINYSAVVQAFTKQINEGFHLQILNYDGLPLSAVVKFFDASIGAPRSQHAYSGADGYARRMLYAGKYRIVIYSEGYETYSFTLEADASALATGITQTVRLAKSSGQERYAYRLVGVTAPESAPDYPFDALAAPDGRSCRLSKKGTITLAFKEECKTSLKVYAAASETGTVKIYGLTDLDGNEIYLGLAGANGEITLNAPYSIIKILDNGAAANPTAGFALDAVGCIEAQTLDEEESAEEEFETADGDGTDDDYAAEESTTETEIERDADEETADDDEPEISQDIELTQEIYDNDVTTDQDAQEADEPSEYDIAELSETADETINEDDNAKNNDNDPIEGAEYEYVDWGELPEWYFEQIEEESESRFEAETIARKSSSSGCANSPVGVYIAAVAALLSVGRLLRARLK